VLAAAGTMDQIGHRYERAWGDMNDPSVLKRVMTFVRAASAVAMLRGQTFGTFGGRPLGMYTEAGMLSIVEANPASYQEISSCQVQRIKNQGRGCKAPSVISNGRLYCRSYYGELSCIDVRN
jgi:L-fucose isomerase-like protein